MRLLVRTPIALPWIVLIVSVVGLAGCGQNSQILQGQNKRLLEQQQIYANQQNTYQSRLSTLADVNNQKETMLAQAIQQAKISEEKAALLQQRLADTSRQLEKVTKEKDDSQKQVKMMTASLQRKGHISISPNSSVRTQLPDINLPGVDVRRDGEVIRIILPADRLFEPNQARLRGDALNFLAQVGSEVQRMYPGQMIGIEAHTNKNPAPVANYRNAHELSVAWAVAVSNYLTSQTRLAPQQLTVAGHGSNYPRYSNPSARGAQLNRRVELVVYPNRMR
jgi:flagellar motor protein MotB